MQTKTETCYKLTDQDLCTYCDYQWQIGQWHETDGAGDLCGPGWLHAYSDPVLAVLLNPIHAEFKAPRLFEACGAGKKQGDRGLKCGYTRLQLIKELPVPEVTTVQRVAFGIYCTMEVCHDQQFVTWARSWLDGSDRSAESARAAAEENWADGPTVAMAERTAARAAARKGRADTRAMAEAAALAAMYATYTKLLDLPAIARRAMEVR